MVSETDIETLAREMPPITLEEMASVRLMKRTDQKFVTNMETLVRLLALCREGYYAQEIAGRRTAPYATTYWDTEGTQRLFHLHEAGHRPRMKVRVRTYVSSDISFLEVKRKDNHGKTRKKRISVPSLDAVIQQGEGEAFLQAETGLTWADIAPAVGNRFKRLTLVNRAKTERLTIDFDLHFHNYHTGEESEMGDAVIIELKRDGRAPSPILPLLRKLRIHPSGFSKYCVGQAVTDPSLKINRFKKRMVKIKKAIEKTPRPAPEAHTEHTETK